MVQPVWWAGKSMTAINLRNKIGAGNRVRTGDLNLGKVALYQLSYSRMHRSDLR